MSSDPYLVFKALSVSICLESRMLIYAALRDHGRLDAHQADVRTWWSIPTRECPDAWPHGPWTCQWGRAQCVLIETLKPSRHHRYAWRTGYDGNAVQFRALTRRFTKPLSNNESLALPIHHIQIIAPHQQLATRRIRDFDVPLLPIGTVWCKTTTESCLVAMGAESV